MKNPLLSPVIAGGALIAVNATAGAFDAVIVRFVSEDIHVFEIAFFRNAFSLLFLLPFLVRAGGLDFSSRFWGIHALRAFLKLGALVAYFLAILQLPLSVAMSIAFTTPLFTAFGSIVFLGERARPARVISALVCIVGVLIVLRPGAAPIGSGAALALASAVGLGLVGMLMKLSAGREQPARIVWLNLVITVPIAFLLCLPFWTTPSLPMLGLLALQGACGAIAQLSVAKALSLADASVVMPVDFIRLPIAIVLGAVIFSETTDAAVYVGGAIIFASAMMLIRLERGRARQPIEAD